jgi:hypothetical protein
MVAIMTVSDPEFRAIGVGNSDHCGGDNRLKGVKDATPRVTAPGSNTMVPCFHKVSGQGGHSNGFHHGRKLGNRAVVA